MMDNIKDIATLVKKSKKLVVVYNNTTTTLHRVNVEGEALWVGTPVHNKTGQRSAYALHIDVNGHIDGGAAMNFIAAGGWNKHTKRPNRSAYMEAVKAFSRMFYAAALVYAEEEGAREVRKSVENLVGYPTKVFNWEDPVSAMGERELFSALGLTANEAMVLESNGLTLDVAAKDVASKYVKPTYATVTGGAWDADSHKVAITSNMPLGICRYLQSQGVRLARVKRKAK